jgi:hypothetical protein
MAEQHLGVLDIVLRLSDPSLGIVSRCLFHPAYSFEATAALLMRVALRIKLQTDSTKDLHILFQIGVADPLIDRNDLFHQAKRVPPFVPFLMDESHVVEDDT